MTPTPRTRTFLPEHDIVIPRSDLPEVERIGRGWKAGDVRNVDSLTSRRHHELALMHLALAEHLDAQQPTPLKVGERVKIATPRLANGETSPFLARDDEGHVGLTFANGDIWFQRDGIHSNHEVYVAAENVERIEDPQDLFARNLEAFKHEAETPMREHGECCDPTPTLPAEPGAIIRATGSEGGIPFRDRVLVRGDSGTWRGDVDGGYVDLSLSRDRIDTFTVLATHDPATQAVVPRKEWEALKSEVRSVAASAGADLDPDPYIARKARALVRAAEEAER